VPADERHGAPDLAVLIDQCAERARAELERGCARRPLLAFVDPLRHPLSPTLRAIEILAGERRLAGDGAPLPAEERHEHQRALDDRAIAMRRATGLDALAIEQTAIGERVGVGDEQPVILADLLLEAGSIHGNARAVPTKALGIRS
jgi:hypothetical protein